MKFNKNRVLQLETLENRVLLSVTPTFSHVSPTGTMAEYWTETFMLESGEVREFTCPNDLGTVSFLYMNHDGVLTEYKTPTTDGSHSNSEVFSLDFMTEQYVSLRNVSDTDGMYTVIAVNNETMLETELLGKIRNDELNNQAQNLEFTSRNRGKQAVVLGQLGENDKTDCYKIEIEEDGIVHFQLHSVTGKTHYLELYDSSRNLIASSTDIDGFNKVLNSVRLEKNTYYLRVNGTEGALEEKGLYALTITEGCIAETPTGEDSNLVNYLNTSGVGIGMVNGNEVAMTETTLRFGTETIRSFDTDGSTMVAVTYARDGGGQTTSATLHLLKYVGATWQEITSVTYEAGNLQSVDVENFGTFVSISGNSILVGSTHGTFAQIFTLEREQLVKTTLNEVSEAVVAVCLEDNLAFVSTTSERIYVFQRSENTWNFEITLTGETNSGFGSAFAWDATSSRLCVACPKRNQVYVYNRLLSGDFVDKKIVEASPSSIPGTADSFGRVVALNGDALAVSYLLKSGSTSTRAVQVYHWNSDSGAWGLDDELHATTAGVMNFGDTISISGDQLAIGSKTASKLSGENTGVVYLYQEKTDGSQRSWELTKTFQHSEDGYFGTSVVLVKNRLMVLDSFPTQKSIYTLTNFSTSDRWTLNVTDTKDVEFRVFLYNAPAELPIVQVLDPEGNSVPFRTLSVTHEDGTYSFTPPQIGEYTIVLTAANKNDISYDLSITSGVYTEYIDAGVALMPEDGVANQIIIEYAQQILVSSQESVTATLGGESLINPRIFDGNKIVWDVPRSIEKGTYTLVVSGVTSVTRTSVPTLSVDYHYSGNPILQLKKSEREGSRVLTGTYTSQLSKNNEVVIAIPKSGNEIPNYKARMASSAIIPTVKMEEEKDYWILTIETDEPQTDTVILNVAYFAQVEASELEFKPISSVAPIHSVQEATTIGMLSAGETQNVLLRLSPRQSTQIILADNVGGQLTLELYQGNTRLTTATPIKGEGNEQQILGLTNDTNSEVVYRLVITASDEITMPVNYELVAITGAEWELELSDTPSEIKWIQGTIVGTISTDFQWTQPYDQDVYQFRAYHSNANITLMNEDGSQFSGSYILMDMEGKVVNATDALTIDALYTLVVSSPENAYLSPSRYVLSVGASIPTEAQATGIRPTSRCRLNTEKASGGSVIKITMDFSENLDWSHYAEFPTSAISVTNEDGSQTYTASSVVIRNDRQAEFTFSDVLPDGIWTLTLNESIYSVSGKAFVLGTPQNSYLSADFVLDTTPPMIEEISVNPEARTFSVTFSEDIYRVNVTLTGKYQGEILQNCKLERNVLTGNWSENILPDWFTLCLDGIYDMNGNYTEEVTTKQFGMTASPGQMVTISDKAWNRAVRDGAFAYSTSVWGYVTKDNPMSFQFTLGEGETLDTRFLENGNSDKFHVGLDVNTENNTAILTVYTDEDALSEEAGTFALLLSKNSVVEFENEVLTDIPLITLSNVDGKIVRQGSASGMLSSAGETDTYRFQISAGGSISVTLSDLITGESILKLYEVVPNVDGGKLLLATAGGDSACDTVDARISGIVNCTKSDKTYLLEVSNMGKGRTGEGTYNLVITENALFNGITTGNLDNIVQLNLSNTVVGHVSNELSIMFNEKRLQDALYGYTVVASGNHLIVGVPGDNVNGVVAGEVQIYEFDGLNYRKIAVLNADAPQLGDNFGANILLDGNTLLVSAPNHHNNDGTEGAIYIYSWNEDGNISLQRTITNPQESKIADFGSVMDYSDGVLVVGSKEGKASEVWVFNQNNAPFCLTEDVSSQAGFGASVAIEHGNILVTAPSWQQHLDLNGDENSCYGMAILYTLNGNSVMENPLQFIPRSGDSMFGFSSAIEDGNIVIVAVSPQNKPVLYWKNLNENDLKCTTSEHFPELKHINDRAVTFQRDTLTLAGCLEGNQALVLKLNEQQWSFVYNSYISPDVAEMNGDYGFSASFGSSTHFVSAPSTPVGYLNEGVVYSFDYQEDYYRFTAEKSEIDITVGNCTGEVAILLMDAQGNVIETTTLANQEPCKITVIPGNEYILNVYVQNTWSTSDYILTVDGIALEHTSVEMTGFQMSSDKRSVTLTFSEAIRADCLSENSVGIDGYDVVNVDVSADGKHATFTFNDVILLENMPQLVIYDTTNFCTLAGKTLHFDTQEDDTFTINLSGTVETIIGIRRKASSFQETHPQSEKWVHEWNSLWVEIWGRVVSSTPNGFTTYEASVSYDPQLFKPVMSTDGKVQCQFDRDVFANLEVTNDTTSNTLTIRAEVVNGKNVGAVTDENSSDFALITSIKFAPSGIKNSGVPIQFEEGTTTLLPENIGIAFVENSIDVCDSNGLSLASNTKNMTGILPVVYPVSYDLNEDGTINILDLVRFARNFSGTPALSTDAAACDFNSDGSVNILDLVLFAKNFGVTGDNISISTGLTKKWDAMTTIQPVTMTVYDTTMSPMMSPMMGTIDMPLNTVLKSEKAETPSFQRMTGNVAITDWTVLAPMALQEFRETERREMELRAKLLDEVMRETLEETQQERDLEMNEIEWRTNRSTTLVRHL